MDVDQMQAEEEAKRPRVRRRTVAMVGSHLVLAGWGVLALVLLVDQRQGLRESERNRRFLSSQLHQLQQRLYDPHADGTAADGDRAAHYVRRIARDTPGVSGEIYKDRDLGNVAEFLNSRLRYDGPVLPDAVVEAITRELAGRQALARYGPVIAEYHRFVKRSPHARRAAPPAVSADRTAP